MLFVRVRCRGEIRGGMCLGQLFFFLRENNAKQERNASNEQLDPKY